MELKKGASEMYEREERNMIFLLLFTIGKMLVIILTQLEVKERIRKLLAI